MRAWSRCLLSVLCAALVATAAVWATPGTETAPVAPHVKTEVLQRYRVLLISDGVVLTPKRGTARAVEIREGAIALDGAPVTGRELRAALGADADLVMQLSYASPQALRAAFGPAGEAPPEPTPETLPPTAPEPPAATPPEPPTSPEPPEPPAPHRHRSSAKVHFLGDITVEENEIVTDPVVAIGGSVTVLGQVEDDVVAIGGGVRLGPKAVVKGSVTSVGGQIEQEPGSEVRGEVNEVAFSHGPVQFGPAHWWSNVGREMFSEWFRLFGTILRISLVLLLALVISIALERPVGRIATRAGDEPWLSGFVGLAAQVFFVPVLVVTIVVLAISIIGIPLLVLVPFVLLALLFGVLMGFAGVARRVGAWAVGSHRGPLVATAVGVVLIAAGAILARLLWLLPGPVAPIAIVVSLVGLFLEYVAWTVGIGAMLLTRFGTRGRGDTPVGGQWVPPPVPPPPPPPIPATDTPVSSRDLPLQE